MRKKYIVRLSDAERESLGAIVKEFAGSPRKVRRAQVRLEADADGPARTDAEIVDAHGCRRQTVEKSRERFVAGDSATTRPGPPRAPRGKLLAGDREAEVVALRSGPPPAGFAHRTRRRLAERVVELEIAEAVGHETVRRTRKKTR